MTQSLHHFPGRNATVSTPHAESNEPEFGMGWDVTTYVFDGSGQLIGVSDARRERVKLVEVQPPPEPKVDLTYDRSRHVIRIRETNGKTAEFDDRPVRFLVLDRNPVTKALEPVIIHGEPLYYYLAREVL